MDELIERLERASSELRDMGIAALDRHQTREWRRLSAKREGVVLALSYAREEQRNATQ